jgi:hypothetical protein
VCMKQQSAATRQREHAGKSSSVCFRAEEKEPGCSARLEPQDGENRLSSRQARKKLQGSVSVTMCVHDDAEDVPGLSAKQARRGYGER